jgi:hypothetical protein
MPPRTNLVGVIQSFALAKTNIINGGRLVSTADIHDCSLLHNLQHVVLGIMGQHRQAMSWV